MKTNNEIIKTCKDVMDDVKIEDLRKSIQLIEEDNSYSYLLKLYNDYDNKDIYFCIGVDDEKNIIYKLGILDSHTMLLDTSDIMMPYDEEENEIYDTECTIGSNISKREWQYIKNHIMPDFIRYCTKNHFISKKSIWDD